jgi:hypothetical protein
VDDSRISRERLTDRWGNGLPYRGWSVPYFWYRVRNAIEFFSNARGELIDDTMTAMACLTEKGARAAVAHSEKLKYPQVTTAAQTSTRRGEVPARLLEKFPETGDRG